MRALALILPLAALPAAAGAPPALEPGVPLAPAQWRAKHYRDVRYALDLKLSRLNASGRLRVTVTLPRRPVDLVLDWRGGAIRGLEVNGRPLPAEVREQHLVVPAGALKGGRNPLSLAFEAPVAVSGAALTRHADREDGAEYVHSLFVPADASSVFPCLDQPDLKARFLLEAMDALERTVKIRARWAGR